jgi:hypothetical protein
MFQNPPCLAVEFRLVPTISTARAPRVDSSAGLLQPVRFSQRRTSQRHPPSRKSIACLGLETRLPHAPRGVLHGKLERVVLG